VAVARAIVPIEGPLDADVALPGSKSLTNRALVCALLAHGRSELTGVLRADDTEAMLGCVEALGAGVEVDWDAAKVVVEGVGGHPRPGPATIDARMSGTTARFLAPVLALGSGEYLLTGHPQLASRPMAPAFTALRELGAEVEERADTGYLPAVIRAPGRLAGGRIRQPGHVSSQFLSGLLLAAPAMRAGLVVQITSQLVSKPYIALTESVMGHFGVPVGHQARGSEYVVHAHDYRATSYAVEPDASSASYFFAAAAILGGRVRVEGIGRGSRQGDLRFVDLLGRMGADVQIGRGWTEVRGTSTLRGITTDMAELSDTAPTLAVVAALASSPTRVTGIGFIRRKETNRIKAVVDELRRCGVDAVEEPDGFAINPGGAHGALVETYEDHRMAMSFAVLGLRVPGIEIKDPGCVAKTFPGFFDALDGLRDSSG
jgi:3-phosphoshikimate 1-carboxyvinyltransferase